MIHYKDRLLLIIIWSKAILLTAKRMRKACEARFKIFTAEEVFLWHNSHSKEEVAMIMQVRIIGASI